MNARGLLVLLVLACVVHAYCHKKKKSASKSLNPSLDKFGKNDGVSVKNDKGTKGNGKNSKSEKHNKKGEKSNSEGENVLSNIATLIQSCIDNRTMNNKTFKKRLDTLYKNSARPKIDEAIKVNFIRVIKIEKQYEEDKQILKMMNSNSDMEK